MVAGEMAKKLVSVVITTRNRKDDVLACISSIYSNDYPRIEVILADNASCDGTIEAVKKNYPRVKPAVAKENLGLNGGKNLGQKLAKGEYVFFLDSDTLVDKKLLSELVKTADSDSRVGIVCPKMYYFDQKNVIWYAGSFVNLLTSRTYNIGCNEEDNGQYDQLRETQFAPTAYLVKRSVINKLKGHDETFFMTYGDTDYGFRARENGFKVLFCPTAKLWHRLGKKENSRTIRALGYNLPMRAYYFARNRVIFMKKHAPKLNFLLFMVIFFPLFTIYFLFKIIYFRGGWQFIKPHLYGSFDGLKYLSTNKVKNIYK